uniref:Retrovirus-related Pol polyprotein from transposon TNT 1-94 n=1 Tax=Tanacetum cinerariifolium TaxID=118510 RepID=A0A699L2S3_TANCI|nr:retrovirus-related Pol polyprotein from transposon TNT 1-94 [Tanacetum cinerariifolium]
MDENGVVIRIKARLVAQGYRQEKGVEYDENFELVSRLEAIKIFLAYAAYMGFVVYQLDKALYGLKQAPRACQLADYDVLYDKVHIFCDNTSVIAILKNPVLHFGTKHIDVRHHFIRDYILKCDIKLHFVPTNLQLADIFTKSLAEPSFLRLVAELDMLNIDKEVSDKAKVLSDPLT